MSSDTEMGGGSPTFPTTRPSFVAGMATDAAGGRARAADALVRSYWKPIYKYVRLRFGKTNEDAKDLTQGFLGHVIESGWMTRFDPRRGTFRSFLRLSLDGYVANDEKARARDKRGGGRALLELDFGSAESELAGREPMTADTVEAWFDAEWRRDLFTAAIAELEQRLRCSGHAVRAEIFRRYDLADRVESRPTYEQLSCDLGVDVHAVTNHLFAARRALRDIVLARLREETADEVELQAELRALIGGA